MTVKEKSKALDVDAKIECKLIRGGVIKSNEVGRAYDAISFYKINKDIIFFASSENRV